MTSDIRIPIPRSRFIVLHYHLFKNAGSTLAHVLRRNFGVDYANFHGDDDDAILDAGHQLDLVREHNRLRAISSHHLRYPRPAARGIVFFDLCFLRHPLTRIRSLYHYGRKLDPTHWLGQLTQTLDEAGFVEHLLHRQPHTLSDVQTHFLANASAFTRPAGPRDLRIALALLEDMAAPGVVEMFDESLTCAEYFLRPAFPEIALEYTVQNVSAPGGARPSDDPEALNEACRQAWGNGIYDAVAALNRQDLQLYAAAREEVARRLRLLPQPETALAGFRERCRRLATGE